MKEVANRRYLIDDPRFRGFRGGGQMRYYWATLAGSLRGNAELPRQWRAEVPHMRCSPEGVSAWMSVVGCERKFHGRARPRSGYICQRKQMVLDTAGSRLETTVESQIPRHVTEGDL